MLETLTRLAVCGQLLAPAGSARSNGSAYSANGASGPSGEPIESGEDEWLKVLRLRESSSRVAKDFGMQAASDVFGFRFGSDLIRDLKEGEPSLAGQGHVLAERVQRKVNGLLIVADLLLEGFKVVQRTDGVRSRADICLIPGKQRIDFDTFDRAFPR